MEDAIVLSLKRYDNICGKSLSGEGFISHWDNKDRVENVAYYAWDTFIRHKNLYRIQVKI